MDKRIRIQGTTPVGQNSKVDFTEREAKPDQCYGKAVSAFGIKCPIIREGDPLCSIVVDSVISSSVDLEDGDIIGITESVVARSLGVYATIDDVAKDVERILHENGVSGNAKETATVAVYMPIYSRNRFAMILKGIARAVHNIVFVMPDIDEVGNVSKNHPFTGMDYEKYYAEICAAEGCDIHSHIYTDGLAFCTDAWHGTLDIDLVIDCRMHPTRWNDPKVPTITLKDICKDKSDWGLLGSNKSTEERLKLFPSPRMCQGFCRAVKSKIKIHTGVDVAVCVYGDGCFKDPVTGIWEFADPVTMPGFTDADLFISTPNEVKMKALIDQSESDDDVIRELQKKGDLFGKMGSMGTTPRLRRDLIASLMDLVSGSGDRATPVVVVKNYC